MNQDLRNDLLRDDLLRAMTQKKKKHRAGVVAAVVLPVLLAIWLLPSDEMKPLAEQAPEFTEVEAPEPNYTVLKSEDDLLEHLADLGPVLVTRADGSTVLFLTKQ